MDRYVLSVVAIFREAHPLLAQFCGGKKRECTAHGKWAALVGKNARHYWKRTTTLTTKAHTQDTCSAWQFRPLRHSGLLLDVVTAQSGCGSSVEVRAVTPTYPNRRHTLNSRRGFSALFLTVDARKSHRKETRRKQKSRTEVLWKGIQSMVTLPEL